MSAASLVTWVAKTLGSFKHGLDVGLVYIAGGSVAMATTISATHRSPKALARGHSRQAQRCRYRDACLDPDTTNQSLMVVPEIHAAQDLRGKRLGITRYGSLSDMGTGDICKLGLTRQGCGLCRLAACLRSCGDAVRAIQGGAISSPTLRAKLRYRELIDLGTWVSTSGHPFDDHRSVHQEQSPDSDQFPQRHHRSRIFRQGQQRSVDKHPAQVHQNQ
jgi:hypothetical protein